MKIYETPWDVQSLDGAWFYHRCDLPGLGTVGGDWDIRDCAGAYLGNYDFSGKRVLDVGAASGFLTFEMEKRGAEVVSFDLDDGANWNIAPHYMLRGELKAIRDRQSETLVRMKKAYWLAHRLMESKARAHYGDIYAMNNRLGDFDVVYYGMIVGHLRDVFQALYQGARRCRKTIIITSIFEVNDTPRATFIPNGERWDNLGVKSWWSMTTGLIKNMLGVLGFKVADIVESDPMITAVEFTAGRRKCQTIVAHRI